MKRAGEEKALAKGEREALLGVARARFEKNMSRHPAVAWASVLARLEAAPEKFWALNEMEKSGGEPDVVVLGDGTDAIAFVDCSEESPAGRRSLCYDRAGLDSRKEHKPANSALDMANALGIELLTPEQYQALQSLGAFDQKTSSWLQTPDDIRKLGGALFGDRRYGHVFIYHNGAQSFYAARAFRGLLRI